MSTFLEDIEAVRHNEAIESGNLRKAKRVSAPFSQTWKSQGIVARVQSIECLGCGTTTMVLHGIFTKHVRGQDSRYEPWAGDLKTYSPPKEILPQKVGVCGVCI